MFTVIQPIPEPVGWAAADDKLGGFHCHLSLSFKAVKENWFPFTYILSNLIPNSIHAWLSKDYRLSVMLKGCTSRFNSQSSHPANSSG